MIDPAKIDFNQLPKKYCEGAVGAYGKEVFSFAIVSGNNLDTFATNPKTMKHIALWMNTQVQSYEKQFGEIDMTQPELQSPIQAADLEK